MRAILVLLVIVVIVAIAAVSLGFVNVSGKPGTLPTIAVKGGTAPEINIATANVSVGVENHVVQTPTVDVRKPQ